MKNFKDLNINDKFIIPITSHFGKSISDLDIDKYRHYVKISNKKAAIINTKDKINKGFQGEIEIPYEEYVILIEEEKKDE